MTVVILIYINIFLKLLALLIYGFFVLPIQIEESKVSNGIGRIRKLLLGIGFSIMLTNIIGIIIHVCRLMSCSPLLVEKMVIIYALNGFLASLAFYIIYKKR